MENLDFKDTGRNDPCPCGSGKKFKKCHADQVAWKGNVAPTPNTESSQAQSEMPQFDPSKMDLNWLMEFSTAMQRLPKGQLQQLQALMQKMMAGKDVAREMEELQKKLPPSMQNLLSRAPKMDEALQAEGQSEPSRELTAEEKEKLAQIQKSNEKTGLSKIWSKFWKK